MASIIRPTDTKFWHACYRDAQGVQRRKSTGETDKRKALRIAEQFEAIAKRKVRPSFLRAQLADLVRETYGEEIKSATVASFVNDWLKTKEPEIGVKTFAVYRASAQKFLRHLGPLASQDIASLSKTSILGYRADLVQTIRPSSVNHDLDIVRAICRAAKGDGYLLEDPTEFVQNVKRENAKSPRRPFTVDELRAILEVADDEWRSMIKFGLYTGQRLTDIASLCWSNIDLSRNIIRIVTRKTGRTMTIPIAGPLEKHILSLPCSDDPKGALHPRSLRRITVKSETSGRLSNEFTAILAAAGIRKAVKYAKYRTGPRGRKNTQDISFHSLRHTAVSLLKDAGIPQAVVQELIGHSSQKMSALYTHTGIDALRRAAEALPVL